MTKFVLASASERRVGLLNQIKFHPDVVHPAEIDETPLRLEKPVKYVERIALAKATAVSVLYQDDVVLVCDTTVALGKRIFGKPANAKEAEKFMKMLNGRKHKVFSSIVVTKAGVFKQRTVCTVVKFKHMDDEDIKILIKTGEWEGKCGGYMLQGMASAFIANLEGSYSNVIGLPLEQTYNLLKSFGLKPAL